MRTKHVLAILTLVSMTLAVRPADASCIPGFDYAVFAKGNIHIENNCGTDSYNSSVAPYASGGCEGNLGTNAAVVLENSVSVCGTASTAGGGVSTANSATYTTPKKTITALTLADVTVPSWPAAGAATWSDNATHVVAPNNSYTTLGCTGNNTILSLSAGDYVANTVNIAKCTVKVTSGPVFVYVKWEAALTFSRGVNVNVPSSSGLPTNLVFLYAGTEDVNFSQLTTVYAGIYAPNATIHVNNQVNIYGAMVGGGSEVHIEQHSTVHYDQAMANLGGGGFACPSKEVTRSTPIVASIDGQTSLVQGTYQTPVSAKTSITTTASVAAFQFPYIQGHLRARTAASISTSGSTFSSGTLQFDAGAAGKIPSVNNTGCSSYDGTCRNMFTVTQTPNESGQSFHPPLVQLNNTNASTIGALIAPTTAVTGITSTHWTSIVQKVLAGKLGGVDRSTVAVIGASLVAGSATRPTIAYFGATDGMLHAVCASVGGSTASDTNICPSLGTELWAFLPRTQLPLIRGNNQRIDGSVRVVDAFGDFGSPATGSRGFRTILTFQTGFADATVGSDPAVYSLDVTDPANPTVIWEYTPPAASATYKLGTGLVVASSQVLVDGKPTNLVFAETTNGGTAGTGMVTTAINLETGVPLWQFGYAYPTPPRGVAADLPLPTGVPGGAVAVDLQKTGFTSELVMGDLYGNLWRLDAATGASKTGTGVPLFQFATNKHPIGALPAIYSDGNKQYAVFGSGGYADHSTTTWTTSTQYLIGISLTASATSYPIAETATTKLAFKTALTAGEKVFGQVLVVGSELFVTTDSTDVNLISYGTGGNTGSVVGYNLTTATASTAVVVRGGAASLANVGTTLYSSSSDQQQQLASDAIAATGATVDTQVAPKLERRLWLRTQ